MHERRKIFLHIGAPKSGTTYLQKILDANRAALRQAGLLYPSVSHFVASQDLRDMQFKRHSNPRVSGAWSSLVAEVERWPGNAVIDHELLAAATPKHIARAINDLRFADVHVIWTDRDMARQLPAAWQESIKNRETITFAHYIEAVRAKPPAGGRQRRIFWSLHDAPAILARWSRDLPADRVHVIPVPARHADRLELWRRFARVLGIDPKRYAVPDGNLNSSLGAAEAAALRDFNAMSAGIEIPWPVYATVIKHGVPRRLNRQSGNRIELPEDVFDWTVQWSRDAIAKLRAADYDPVGDLDELIPAERPTGADPDRIPAEERADAALAMLAAALDLVATRGLRGTDQSVIARREPRGAGELIRALPNAYRLTRWMSRRAAPVVAFAIDNGARRR